MHVAGLCSACSLSFRFASASFMFHTCFACFASVESATRSKARYKTCTQIFFLRTPSAAHANVGLHIGDLSAEQASCRPPGFAWPELERTTAAVDMTSATRSERTDWRLEATGSPGLSAKGAEWRDGGDDVTGASCLRLHKQEAHWRREDAEKGGHAILTT